MRRVIRKEDGGRDVRFYSTYYTTKVELKQVLGMTTVVNLNQDSMEVQIYRDQIKVIVPDYWDVYKDDWGVSTNIIMDDVKHTYSV